MNSILNNTSILLEYFGGTPEEDEVEQPLVPFESIKKSIIYNNFIDLRTQLENLKDPDTEINSIIDHITIIIDFFSDYSLDDVSNLLNNLIELISDNWSIKIPDALPPKEPTGLEGIPKSQTQPVEEEPQQPIPAPQKQPE